MKKTSYLILFIIILAISCNMRPQDVDVDHFFSLPEFLFSACLLVTFANAGPTFIALLVRTSSGSSTTPFHGSVVSVSAARAEKPRLLQRRPPRTSWKSQRAKRKKRKRKSKGKDTKQS